MGVTGDKAIPAASGGPGPGMGVVINPVLLSTQGHNRDFTQSLAERAATTANQERVSDCCLTLRRSAQPRNKPALRRGAESWGVNYPYTRGQTFVAAAEINQTSSFAASHHQFPYMPLPAQEGWQQVSNPVDVERSPKIVH